MRIKKACSRARQPHLSMLKEQISDRTFITNLSSSCLLILRPDGYHGEQCKELWLDVYKKFKKLVIHVGQQMYLFPFSYGRFSFECPKTKTKVITMAKLKEGKHHKEPMRIQSKMNCSKRGKTRVTKLRFLFGPAFDWLKEWASFCLNSKL